MQAGAKAPQCFHSWISGSRESKKVLATIRDYARTVPAFTQPWQRSRHAERDRCVDRQPQGFNIRRIFDSWIQHTLEQRYTGSQKRTKQGRNDNNQALARANRIRRIDHSGVNNPNIANRASTGDIQLLGLVEQCSVELIADLKITGQTEKLLLRVWKSTYFALETRLPGFQFANLPKQGTICWMLTGKAAIHLRLPQPKLLDAGLDRNFLFKQTLGLHRDINRVGTGLICTHCSLCLLDLQPNCGQLLLDELKL